VLVTMALTAAGVFGVVGLAVDVGRVLIARNELQVFSDSASMAAALALDGTSAGIGRAASAAAVSTNKWNFSTSFVNTPAVAFAAAPAGPWVNSPTPAAGYSYVRVIATAPVKLYFLSLLTGQGTFSVVSSAVSGQAPLNSLLRGLAPYTAVSTNTDGPDFGFIIGNSYTIHWPTYNSSRSGCGPEDPSKCFNSPPCSGDASASLSAVVANWGSQYHGYWGSNSNSEIAAEVINAIQLAPVSVGANLAPLLTPGNKQSEARYLDQRASQDTDTSDSTPALYFASASHNGRRLLPVAIADPVDPLHTTVLGFGLFLLYANGSPSDYYNTSTNGNSPYCAVYAGPYNVGSSSPGVGGATGASVVRLVE